MSSEFIPIDEIPTIIRDSEMALNTADENNDSIYRINKSNSTTGLHYHFDSINMEVILPDNSTSLEQLQEVVTELSHPYRFRISLESTEEQIRNFADNLIEKNFQCTSVNWNVQGIPRTDSDTFIGDLYITCDAENFNVCKNIAIDFGDNITTPERRNAWNVQREILEEVKPEYIWLPTHAKRIERTLELGYQALSNLDNTVFEKGITRHELGHVLRQDIAPFDIEGVSQELKDEINMHRYAAFVYSEAMSMFGDFSGANVIEGESTHDTYSKLLLSIRLLDLITNEARQVYASNYERFDIEKFDIDLHLKMLANTDPTERLYLDEHDMAMLLLMLGPEVFDTEGDAIANIDESINAEIILQRIDDILEDPDAFLDRFNVDFYNRLESAYRSKVKKQNDAIDKITENTIDNIDPEEFIEALIDE